MKYTAPAIVSLLAFGLGLGWAGPAAASSKSIFMGAVRVAKTHSCSIGPSVTTFKRSFKITRVRVTASGIRSANGTVRISCYLFLKKKSGFKNRDHFMTAPTYFRMGKSGKVWIPVNRYLKHSFTKPGKVKKRKNSYEIRCEVWTAEGTAYLSRGHRPLTKDTDMNIQSKSFTSKCR